MIAIWFEPRDLWIGIYIERPYYTFDDLKRWVVYICFIPMLPIRVTWVRKTNWYE